MPSLPLPQAQRCKSFCTDSSRALRCAARLVAWQPSGEEVRKDGHRADGSMVEGIGVGHRRAMGLTADHFMDHLLGTRAPRH